MKKIACIFLSLCLAIVCAGSALAEGEALRFDKNGEFKILIIADTQDDNTPEHAMLQIENAALDADSWDLVVFLGDQIHGPTMGSNQSEVFSAIRGIVQPVADRGIPFSIVFGNHDDEGGISKEVQMDYYRSFAGCLAEDGADLYGCGTYALPIEGSGGKPAACLWFFDSGSYDTTGQSVYDWVHEDQLAWFAEADGALTKANGGTPVPGYAFQHIVVPEIYEMLSQAPKDTEGAVEGHGAWEGTWYTLNDTCFTGGSLGEGPCPPDINGGEFAAWQNSGVKAAFFGHDHVNSYEGSYEGIDLYACPGCTYHIYGAVGAHGVRTVTLHEDGSYTTETLFYKDLLGEGEPTGLLATQGSYLFVLLYRFLCGLFAAILAVLAFVLCLRIRKRRKAAPQGGAHS